MRKRIYFLISDANHRISTVEWPATLVKLGGPADLRWGIDLQTEWALAKDHYLSRGDDLTQRDVVVAQYAPDLTAKNQRNRIVWLEDLINPEEKS